MDRLYKWDRYTLETCPYDNIIQCSKSNFEINLKNFRFVIFGKKYIPSELVEIIDRHLTPRKAVGS